MLIAGLGNSKNICKCVKSPYVKHLQIFTFTHLKCKRYNTIGHQFSRFGHQRFFGLAPKFTNGHQKLSFRAPKNIDFGTKIFESVPFFLELGTNFLKGLIYYLFFRTRNIFLFQNKEKTNYL
jgi:hypothetical protein